MQVQLETKEQNLVDTLLNFIDSRTPLDQAIIDEIERGMSSLPKSARDYVTAWLMVAQGRHDDAVAWFQEAMDGPDAATVAGNYVAYLSRSAHNLFHRTETFRLAEYYCTQRLREQARSAAYCFGSDSLVRKYTLKMVALLDGEEREKIQRMGDRMAKVIVNFKEATNLTSADLQHICDEAEKIANDHGVNCIGVEYFLSGGADNAMILNAETRDADTLAEMNMQLIDLLIDKSYIDRPFTSWFRSADAGSIAS